MTSGSSDVNTNTSRMQSTSRNCRALKFLSNCPVSFPPAAPCLSPALPPRTMQATLADVAKDGLGCTGIVVASLGMSVLHAV